MIQQIRYALRGMLHSPGFTAVAVITLALGIGGNTAIFSVINALLLRSLPLSQPARLIFVTASNPKRGMIGGPFSVIAFDTIRERNRSFSGIAASCAAGFTLTGAAKPEQLPAAVVSPDFLDVLGAKPLIGRGFLASEGQPGGAPVVLISNDLWQRRFGSDSAILGKALTLDRQVYTVIGVMAPDFPFPFSGTDVWASKVSEYSGLTQDQIQHGAGYLSAIARLKPGVSIEQAQAETAVLAHQYRSEHPGNTDADPDGTLELTPLRESLVAPIRSTLVILAAAVGLVLLIACGNVAGLLIARASSRGKEIALRTALGASRAMLVRQLLLESVLLAMAGAVLGIVLAQAGVSWLVHAHPVDLPGFEPIRVDLPVLLFTLVVTVLTGIAFGLAPALQATRTDLNAILRAGGRTVAGAGRASLRNALVVGQVALSVVLLIGAGLLGESFARLANVDPGFDAHHTLTMRIALPPAQYPDDAHKAQFWREATTRIAALPGVTAAAATLALPYTLAVMAPVQAEGQAQLPIAQRPLAEWDAITPGYFRSVGIPIRQGRDITWADNGQAHKVAIISESLARSFWPHGDALGRHIVFGRQPDPAEIVGITGDVKNRGLAADSVMLVYSAYAQHGWPGMLLTVRTPGNPLLFAPVVEGQILALDRDLPVTDVRTLEDGLTRSLSGRRQIMALISAFAGVALLLSVVGLYGVLGYSVAQRTTEIGIRQAVGARRGDILGLILGQALRLTLAGITAGGLAALAASRLMSGMLFQVNANDPLTFFAVAVLFLAVALTAALVPAWRAMHVDPVEVLR